MSGIHMTLTEEEMMRLYAVLRSELNNLSIQNIRNTVAAAGFDITRIPAKAEARTGLGSRAEVMPVIDQLFREITPEAKPRALIILAEKLSETSPELARNIEEILRKHGFQFLDHTFVPIGILDAREGQYLPSSSASELARAMERLGAGDYSGAITSACGAVDNLTQSIYLRDENILGKPPNNYSEKVKKVLNHLHVFDEMESEFLALGMTSQDETELVNHIRQATDSAANALRILRSRMGDTHGSKPAIRKTAYDAIKWASAICGLLEGKI